MAVTKQVYTTAATWTATQFASSFRTALIDAGYMSDWYDSFSNGSLEHRILEINYGTGKTYGKTYYWFIFTGASFYAAMATGWNAGTHVPTGTQWLDYVSTATNTVSNHCNLYNFVSTSDVLIIRYTSGTRSYFMFRQGTNYGPFTIDPSNVSLQAWVDLNKSNHNGLYFFTGASFNSGFNTTLEVLTVVRLRRCDIDGYPLHGNTNASAYARGLPVNRYMFLGSQNSGNDNQVPQGGSTGSGMLVPAVYAGQNPAYSSDFNPVWTGIRLSAAHLGDLSADFGIVGVRNNNAMQPQDTLTVSAGVEVWEILFYVNSSSGNSGQASSAFCARTT